MPKYHIIVLKDIVANTYKAPMFVPNIQAAIRDLRDMINNPEMKEDFCRHPEDFELVETGAWDSDTNWWDTPHDGSHTEERQLVALRTLKA